MVGIALEAPFVGRSAELAEVARLLERSRVVTVMGAGGAGKTRLSREAAERLRGRYPGGVFLCELAPVAAGEHVRAALVAALGLPPEAADEAVGERIAGPPALVVVDNCEHVREAAGAVIAWLLRLAPSASVLATSRERLRLPVETAWMLPSMSVADGLALLVDRARARAAGAGLEGKNDVLTEICRRLDGLPLAIELAAARLALLTPEQVMGLLDDSLALLTGGEGSLRHRTMRAALEWSVDLLSAEARDDLWRLSVFAGAFTLDGAAAVLEVAPAGALERLAVLRDASLLVTAMDGGVARYRLLEPVRQFAAEGLRASGSDAETQRRHAAHVVEVAEWIGRNLFGVGLQREALERFSLYLSDIREAVNWSFEHEPSWAPRIMGGSGFVWEITARVNEAAAVMRRCEPLATDPTVRARLLVRLGSIVSRQARTVPSAGPESEQRRIWRRAVEAARLGDDPRELGFAISFYAAAWPPIDGCLELLDEALAIALRERDRLLEAWNRFLRGNALMALGRHAEGRASIEAARVITVELDDEWCTAQATSNLVWFAIQLGDLTSARRHLREVLATLARHPEWSMGVQILGAAAVVAERGGRPADALRLAGARQRLQGATGVGLIEARDVSEAARAQLPPIAAQAALTAGAAMPAAEAFALARRVVEAPAARPDDRLSKRELEVARLVAEGLSNKEIAARLHLSVRTVEGHVEHVLGKLELRSRVQIATWAAEHELLV